jgi:hypothetical protein
MKDHEAFWLIDGKPDTPKPVAASIAAPFRNSPNVFTPAERVDDGTEEIGLYTSTCTHCHEQSPAVCQDLLHQWRHAHAVQHGISS